MLPRFVPLGLEPCKVPVPLSAAFLQGLPTEDSRSGPACRRTEGTCSLSVHCPASFSPARARQTARKHLVRPPVLCSLGAGSNQANQWAGSIRKPGVQMALMPRTWYQRGAAGDKSQPRGSSETRPQALRGVELPGGPEPRELWCKAGNQSSHALQHPLCLLSTGLFRCHQGQTQGQDSEHSRLGDGGALRKGGGNHTPQTTGEPAVL